MKTKPSILLLIALVLTFGLAGCGKTYQQRWVQANAAYIGVVDSLTELRQAGYIDDELKEALTPAIKAGDEALAEMEQLACTCDETPERCDQARWEYLERLIGTITRTLQEVLKTTAGKTERASPATAL